MIKNIPHFLFIIVFWLMAFPLMGQNSFSLSGTVSDDHHLPLPGAFVVLNKGQHIAVSSNNGYFIFNQLLSGKYLIEVKFVGFKSFSDSILLMESMNLNFVLNPTFQNLQEVIVTDHHAEVRKREESLNIEVVNADYLRQNLGGSLMKSLERLPGVTTIDIGSGQSKPVIRGLSFNRVVVVENGIKHEGQQWGADHGLEIDQFAVGRAEVIKGPSSLRYGSDAIGGVIDIKQPESPMPNTFGGSFDLMGKSNNNLIGTSLYLFAGRKNLFITVRGTLIDYADYRVPADSIDIYFYKAPLYENRLRNTAGNEKNIHLSFGLIKESFSSKFYFSNLYSKYGFFANAHGLEPRRVDTDLHDQSDRDVQYPYQTVNHFKVINRTQWSTPRTEWLAEFGFQYNFRQEWSQYVNHGFMPALFDDSLPFQSDLERAFDKLIYTGNLKAAFSINGNNLLTIGTNTEYQQNEIDGMGFIIPAFDQFTTGTFIYFKHDFSKKTILHAGARYDFGVLHIQSYHDWFPSPEISGNDTLWTHLQRATKIERQFFNFSWSVGVNHNIENWSLKANMGKSFRMPIAKELAANGVNYHYFSYEVGNPDLKPETAYQADGGIEWHTRNLAVEVTPFINYFTNYIYLNPTARHDRLYGNGNQVFQYTQSAVLMFGSELHAHYQLTRSLKAGIIGNYLYSEQLSGSKKGFTLPFSSPASLVFNLRYSKMKIWLVEYPYLSVDFKLVASQERIVPPEEKTPDYHTVSASLGGKKSIGGHPVSFALQGQNILNKKYFNHTSFYRLINVPEQGLNIGLNINVLF